MSIFLGGLSGEPINQPDMADSDRDTPQPPADLPPAHFLHWRVPHLSETHQHCYPLLLTPTD